MIYLTRACFTKELSQAGVHKYQTDGQCYLRNIWRVMLWTLMLKEPKSYDQRRKGIKAALWLSAAPGDAFRRHTKSLWKLKHAPLILDLLRSNQTSCKSSIKFMLHRIRHVETSCSDKILRYISVHRINFEFLQGKRWWQLEQCAGHSTFPLQE